MAAVMGQREVGIRQFGNTVTIPQDPRAKLMYYLDCICAVLDLADTANLARLRDYQRYYLLTEAEVDSLVAFTFLISPDELDGKVIFCDAEMCGGKKNTFFELSAVQSNLLISDSIVIGGQTRTVKKIMAYTPQWLMDFWRNPMSLYAQRLARIATGQQTPQRPAIGYYSTNYQTFQRPQYDNGSNGCCCCCTIL